MDDDLLTAIRAEIDARLSELRPLLDEYDELRSAIEVLEPVGHVADLPAASRRSAVAASAIRRSKAAPRRSVARSAVPAAAGRRAGGAPKRARAQAGRGKRFARTSTDRAILAALEHGSHTVAELLVVTALPARDVRDSLRLMRAQRAIGTIDRDGKTAYALPGAGADAASPVA